MPAHTPQQLHTIFVDAFNAGDLDQLAALYEPGAVLTAAGQTATGQEAIRAGLGQFLAMGQKIEAETRLVLESGDGLALLHMAWTLGEMMRGVSAEVARRQPDGTWKYVLDNPMTPLG